MAQVRAADPSVADRQRDRTARGIGSAKKATRFAGDRPSPPRRKRPALAALAVLLIVGGAALAGLLALRLDSREPVLVLAQDVPAGTEITTDLLSTADVASSGLKLVPADQADQVLGTWTTVPLAQGQLLETSVLTTAQPLHSGLVQVGIPLVAGRAPSGLRSGDVVRLVRIGDGNSAPQPIATGLILSTSSDESGGTLGRDAQVSTQARIVVPANAADSTVDAAANERLGLALVDRGISIDEVNLVVLGGGGS